MNCRVKIVAVFFLALAFSFLSGQSTVRLSGKILADDLSPLISAGIYIAQFSSGTLSDSTGHFQVSLKPG